MPENNCAIAFYDRDTANPAMRLSANLNTRRLALFISLTAPVVLAMAADEFPSDPRYLSGPGQVHGPVGQYEVRVDQTGRVYGREGNYRGRIEADGKLTGAQGNSLGRVDAAGHRYDKTGRYLGKTDSNSRLYDAEGCYLGQVDA